MVKSKWELRKTFNFKFDTGSTDLWIYGFPCNNTDLASTCNQHPVCDSKKSHTYRNTNIIPYGETAPNTTFTLFYKGETAFATVAKDTLRVGSIEVPNLVFGSVYYAVSNPGFVFAGAPYDGLFGSAYDPAAQVLNYPSPFTYVIKNKLIPKPVVSFFLNTTVAFNWTTSDHATGGMVTLGGVDEGLIDGPITWLPNKRFDNGPLYYWNINLSCVHTGNTDVLNRSVSHSAFVDAGTSIGLAPRSAIEPMAKAWGATHKKTDDTYVMLCNKTYNFTLVFTFGSLSVTIPNWDLFLTPTGLSPKWGGPCRIAFAIGDREPDWWLLGDVFLRHSYTVFHRGIDAVGLAKPCPTRDCKRTVHYIP
ncbi:acid protease [Gonapodya prolifera JEL478]|uniref:Acid protease n=1 Tax=Gonapodya prolifera (strain JEL478) TaxID=1344416 RepID=A0A139ANI5_GONPJ|nr:acid protease [Gonapodya prolifera JEL478]|eukprot:KXS18083.1 acid protease [Gonapodya prolifera JEL478]